MLPPVPGQLHTQAWLTTTVWDSPPEADHKDVERSLICYRYFFTSCRDNSTKHNPDKPGNVSSNKIITNLHQVDPACFNFS